MSVAMVFPGQGSQSPAMLSDIALHYPEVMATFAEASQVLGYDLWQLTQQGPIEKLDQTVYTQPALLTASYAIWRILMTNGVTQPVLLAGHSLGEYSALVCAEALAFPDAVRLVAARGLYMQEAGAGAMAAIIGLDNSQVLAICEQAIISPQQVLAPANFNSPGQIVIAGDTACVERAIHLAKAQGARLAKMLAMSVASHCALMQPAAQRLEKLLASIPLQHPVIPVLNNVDVKIYQSVDGIREGLVRQLTSPVRWVETIEYFASHGITQIIECGAGKVLTGLNKRIAANIVTLSTCDMESLQITLSMGK